MSFDLKDYAQRRPFLYHLTASANLQGIRADGRLKSASSLLMAAGLKKEIRNRRAEHRTITVNGRNVVLRDQDPLKKGSIFFSPGYDFSDVVELLNRRVFFWAGNEHGPAGGKNSYGQRHFKTYEDECPAILQIGFESLAKVNKRRIPLFCEFNSGAPRCNPHFKATRCKASRGPDTFRSAADFPREIGNVVEVTFLDYVDLPPDTKVASQFSGSWKSL